MQIGSGRARNAAPQIGCDWLVLGLGLLEVQECGLLQLALLLVLVRLRLMGLNIWGLIVGMVRGRDVFHLYRRRLWTINNS